MDTANSILVVEDEGIIAYEVMRTLKSKGYRVSHAYSGEQAIETVRTDDEGVDLVIMDIDLGRGIDGAEAAREILKEHDIPILFSSSHTEDDILKKIESVRSFGYVPKGADDSVLTASIAMAFRLHDARRKLNERTEALEKQQRLLRTLLDALPDLVYVKDDCGRYVTGNQAHAEFLGLPEPQSVAGSTAYDFYSLPEAERIEEEEHKILTGESDRVSAEEAAHNHKGEERWLWSTKVPLRGFDGHPVGLIAISRDVTARKDAERALRTSEQRYRSVVSSLSEGILVHDVHGTIVECNHSAERILGVSKECLVAHRGPTSEWKFLREDGQEYNDDDFPVSVSLRTGRPVRNVVVGIRKPEQHVCWLVLNVHPLFADSDTMPTSAVSSFVDVTERRHANMTLQESERRYRQVVNGAHDVVFETDADGIITFLNPAWERMTEHAPEESIGKHFAGFIHPEDVAKAEATFRDLLEGRLNHACAQVRAHTKSGVLRWTEIHVHTVHDESGGFIGTAGTAIDLTDSKRSEDRLLEAVKDKETLIKEIHHRVKNNLTLVASLLSLQSEHVALADDAQLFAESRNRVMAMARIHEQLYKTSDLTHLNLKLYIQDVVSALVRAYMKSRIRVSTEIDPISTTIDKAIPLGLVVTELVTNSLKYAFPDGREGEVHVKLSAGEQLVLQVSDNGVGLGEAIDLQNTSTLGLNLVHMLTDQMRGVMEVGRTAGTTFTLVVPWEERER